MYTVICMTGLLYATVFSAFTNILYVISAKMASIYLVAMILLSCVLAFIIAHAMKYFSAAFPKYDELNASVQENVSAIRVVKAYVRENHEKDKFQAASNCTFVTSVVRRVTSPAVLNLSILEKAKVCILSNMPFLKFLAKPVEAFAPRRAYAKTRIKKEE